MTYGRSISLVFEVSNDCSLKCNGCSVDKGESLPSSEVMDELIAFYKQFKQTGHFIQELELGPTDLMSSKNRDEIFSNEKLKELAEDFYLITLVCSFIHPDESDYVRFAKQVENLNDKCTIGIAMPFEMRHWNNKKYVDKIKRNVEIFRSNIKNELDETIMNIIVDDNIINNYSQKGIDFDELFYQIKSLEITENTKVDFAFHHGRSNIKDPIVASKFLKSLRLLNEKSITDIKRRNEKTLSKHIPYQLMFDVKGNELIFRKDSLYIRPLINERITIYHDDMKFRGPWTVDNYYEQSSNRLISNIEKASGFNDCFNCKHLSTCAERSVMDLMDITNTKKCITLLKDYDHLITKVNNSDFSGIKELI